MPRRSSKGPRLRPPVLDAGLRILAQRPHSRVELRRKLGRRGYSEEEVMGAVTRLTELGYLDDAAFAEGHIRRRSSSRGPLALQAELAARGVDRGITDSVLAAFGREAELAAATRLVARICARIRPPGYSELLDSVGARLVRRGFSPGVVRMACRMVWAGTASTPEP